MKQTAVEWLVDKLLKGEFINEPEELIQQAKEMEKQAHKETWGVAHQSGRFEGKGIAEENWQIFEGYWKENFKQEEQ